jgi:hypothetical protein
VSSANKKPNIDNRREKAKIVGVATFGVPNEEIVGITTQQASQMFLSLLRMSLMTLTL